MTTEHKPHSVSVADVAALAYRHAKRAWWANAFSDTGEPLGDYPAEEFNAGLEELKAAFRSLEEQLEAALKLLREIDEANPNGYYGEFSVRAFLGVNDGRD